ncbi:Lipid carrier : UDP-N-acetylgalactosaminyltransferase / Alpha-1,3-N-acetylgalactosamine transferase PglA; Putative glycosyltransferase [hydrothermal vent metagenome]|uniref:Lipid carrier: UDP-N-acetylgalactosaminyltransferase / Alpha-1,3-N-acetylgalactosamine transferase PglA Putative glycosyltransferase n=1 Tax=hydrothermal vent metagenome TaxID=652676 RepID=A0A3B1CIF1_9ZZZZ
MAAGKLKIIYFVTEDWYFLSHRAPIARAAQKKGFEVTVATALTRRGPDIMKENFTVSPLRLARSGKNPFSELLSLIEMVRLYGAQKPDIAHHVALKPVVYGAIAAMIARTPLTVNALAGLGHVFVAKGMKAHLVRLLVKWAMRFALKRKRSRTIFQNPEDMKLFIDSGLVNESQAVLIKGSGVDVSLFSPPEKEPAGPPVVALISRMLKTKGVFDFVQAAKILKERNTGVRMVLVGSPDGHNPASIPEETLRQWNEDGAIEYWGQRDDIHEVLKNVSVVVLPSFYGEGVPKSLIEAASSARPIVAYDIAGCREIVHDGVNGILTPLRDTKKLALAIEKLAGDAELANTMGAAGREIAISEFAQEHVIESTLNLYKAGLGIEQAGDR